MNSAERRLKLILLLQRPGGKKTVQELADIFGVSRRTIFRDFNALSEIISISFLSMYRTISSVFFARLSALVKA